jgi:hypothetical protein
MTPAKPTYGRIVFHAHCKNSDINKRKYTVAPEQKKIFLSKKELGAVSRCLVPKSGRRCPRSGSLQSAAKNVDNF